MDINKKYIIIFGTLVLSLIIITGAITYYKEKPTGLVDEIGQDEYFSAPIPEDRKYKIWCYEDKWNDCTGMTSFRPNQLVSISVNLEEFDNIPYNPYFLCSYTDLSGLEADSSGQKLCLPHALSSLPGFVLEDKIVPENQDRFTLLKLTVFPNNDFEETDGIVIMDLKGKLIE